MYSREIRILILVAISILLTLFACNEKVMEYRRVTGESMERIMLYKADYFIYKDIGRDGSHRYSIRGEYTIRDSVLTLLFNTIRSKYNYHLPFEVAETSVTKIDSANCTVIAELTVSYKNEPLSYANVRAYSANKPVMNTTTDFDGKTRLSGSGTVYDYLRLEHTGMPPIKIEIGRPGKYIIDVNYIKGFNTGLKPPDRRCIIGQLGPVAEFTWKDRFILSPNSVVYRKE